VVVLVAVVGLLLGGVTVLELLRYGAWLAVVLAAGWAAWRAFAAEPGGALEQLAMGGAVGFALSTAIGAIVLAAGVEAALPFVLLAVALGLAPRARRRGGAPPTVALTTPQRWAAAAAGAAFLVLVMFAFFQSTPLPGDVPAVDYDKDNVFFWSIAGEAKHHWPVTNPNVAGQELPYHFFAMLDMGSASRVAALELSTVVLRLAPVAWLLLLLALLVTAGRRFGATGWAAAAAAVVPLLAAEADPDPASFRAFENTLGIWLQTNPAFQLAAVFLVAALVLVGSRMAARRPVREAPGEWVLLALLLFGAAGSKGPALAVLVGGLGLLAAWQLLRSRRIDGTVLLSFGLGVATMVAFVLLVFSTDSQGLSVDPFFFLGNMQTLETLRARRSLPLEGPVLATVGLVMLAPAMLVGIAVVLWRDRPGPRSPLLLLLGVLLVGAVATIALAHGGNSQEQFLMFALIPGGLLAVRALAHVEAAGAGARRAALVGVGLAVAAALIALRATYADGLGTLDDHDPNLRWLLVPLGLAIALAVTAAARRRSFPAVLVAAGACAATLAAIDMPVDVAAPAVDRRHHGEPLHSTENRNLTPAIADALHWVRDHTDPDAVIAVNNPWRDEAREDPRYFYYAALAERRTFLGGWRYTGPGQREVDGPPAFPNRRRLNDAVFRRADPAAIETLRTRLGVDLLVVDRLHPNGATPRLAQVARRVYANGQVIIYRP
jgi:hypothetical protein